MIELYQFELSTARKCADFRLQRASVPQDWGNARIGQVELFQMSGQQDKDGQIIADSTEIAKFW